MRFVTVRPSPGLTVRNPEMGFAPFTDDWTETQATAYVRDRIRDGDLVEKTAEPSRKRKAPPAKPAPQPEAVSDGEDITRSDD